MEIDIQKQIQEALEENINKPKALEENINKPIYEFVATYDVGPLTKYIGR